MKLVRGEHAVGAGTSPLISYYPHTAGQHQPQLQNKYFGGENLYFATELQEIQTLLLCVVFKYLDERMQKGELLLNMVSIGTAQCGVQIMKEQKVKVSQNFTVIFFGGLPQNK